MAKLPDLYVFRNNLIFSHRDFDMFMKRLEAGEPSAVVSGLNPSASIHLGHKAFLDTCLFFQKEYGLQVLIPLSDDESYLSKKADTQEDALSNAKSLVKDIIAYGFDKAKTNVIIDQVYTNIYNFAIKLSRHITMSEVKAIYGYKNDQNIGLHFYPSVQSAHVLLPERLYGIKNVLVPIGPDEDAHLRSARDVASRIGYAKPAVIHTRFLPGLDCAKMSKSRNNAIFYHDDYKTIRKKVMGAFSGGMPSVEEHREKGGNPEIDMACIYLKSYYLSKQESEKLFTEYRAGKLLSGEVKEMLYGRIIEEMERFNASLNKVKDSDVESVLMRNDDESPKPKTRGMPEGK
jgi:tryptophanyl-tRNA synthetase